MNQVFNALTPKQNANVRLKVSQRAQKTYFTAQERQLVHVFRITHPSSKRSTATFRSRSVVHIRQGSHERRKTGAFINESQEYSNILTFSCFALVRHVPSLLRKQDSFPCNKYRNTWTDTRFQLVQSRLKTCLRTQMKFCSQFYHDCCEH